MKIVSKCQYCDSLLSDIKGHSCPHCGAPLQYIDELKEDNTDNKSGISIEIDTEPLSKSHSLLLYIVFIAAVILLAGRVGSDAHKHYELNNNQVVSQELNIDLNTKEE